MSTQEATISAQEADAIRAISRKERTEEQKEQLKIYDRETKRQEKLAAKEDLVDFRSEVNSDFLNADGLLTTHEIEGLGYDESKHNRIGKEDFASEDIFMRFQAGQLRARGQAMLDKANEIEQNANNIAQFGDPQKRNALKKVQKLAASLKALTDALKADGIDVEALLAGSGD